MDAVISQIPSADRVVIRHLRVREIRWLRLIFFALLSPCLLPVMLVAMFGPSGTGEDVFAWAYQQIIPVYHDIQIEIIDKKGAIAHRATNRPRDRKEGDALVCRVLLAARESARTVHEVIGTGAGGVVGTWDGTHHLLHPEPDAARAEATLTEQPGVTVEIDGAGVSVGEPHPSMGRTGAFVFLALLGWVLWVLVVTAGGRRVLRHLWWDLNGREPGRRVLRADDEGVHAYLERGGERWDELRVARGDIVAVGHVEDRLGYGGRVPRLGGCPIVITRSTLHPLRAHKTGGHPHSAAIAELLVAHLGG